MLGVKPIQEKGHLCTANRRLAANKEDKLTAFSNIPMVMVNSVTHASIMKYKTE